MAKVTSTATDLTRSLITKSFTATGQSGTFIPSPGVPFNLSLSGFGVATISLQRSFDGGTTWLTVETFSADVEDQYSDHEQGVNYRLNCTAYTSGTIAARMSH